MPLAALMGASMRCSAVVQALEKELANFGKEKDKHMKAAQAKAKKAKADTEVLAPDPFRCLWECCALVLAMLPSVHNPASTLWPGSVALICWQAC